MSTKSYLCLKQFSYIRNFIILFCFVSLTFTPKFPKVLTLRASLSTERSSVCAAALASIPASVRLRFRPHDFASNSNETSIDSDDIELSLSNCPFLSRAEALESLRDEHILFIGDSLSRFQYLNLAYFLLTGRRRHPPGEGSFPQGANEILHSGWEAAADPVNWHGEISTVRLQGHEVCDCSRRATPENRYFFLGTARVRLSYVQWREGSVPISGHNVSSSLLGLNCFEQWLESAPRPKSGLAAAAAVDSAIASARASDVQPVPCVQQCIPGLCFGDSGANPPDWSLEPTRGFAHVVQMLRPTTVLLGTYAWASWGQSGPGGGLEKVIPAMESIARASPSVKRVWWKAGTPNQETVTLSTGPNRLPHVENETEVDRAVVRRVLAAAAAARDSDLQSASKANISVLARRFGVFDASLLLAPLVVEARSDPRYKAQWIDHVHFKPGVYFALNQALVLQIAFSRQLNGNS